MEGQDDTGDSSFDDLSKDILQMLESDHEDIKYEAAKSNFIIESEKAIQKHREKKITVRQKFINLRRIMKIKFRSLTLKKIKFNEEIEDFKEKAKTVLQEFNKVNEELTKVNEELKIKIKILEESSELKSHKIKQLEEELARIKTKIKQINDISASPTRPDVKPSILVLEALNSRASNSLISEEGNLDERHQTTIEMNSSIEDVPKERTLYLISLCQRENNSKNSFITSTVSDAEVKSPDNPTESVGEDDCGNNDSEGDNEDEDDDDDIDVDDCDAQH